MNIIQGVFYAHLVKKLDTSIWNKYTFFSDCKVSPNQTVFERNLVFNKNVATHYTVLKGTPTSTVYTTRKTIQTQKQQTVLSSILSVLCTQPGHQRSPYPSPTVTWSMSTELLIFDLSPTEQCWPMQDFFTDTLSPSWTPTSVRLSLLTPCPEKREKKLQLLPGLWQKTSIAFWVAIFQSTINCLATPLILVGNSRSAAHY